MCVRVQSFRLCVLTLCDPMDHSPPGFSVHGSLQARILEWVARALLQGIFPTQGLNPHLLHCRRILYCWAIREAPANQHHWAFYVLTKWNRQGSDGEYWGVTEDAVARVQSLFPLGDGGGPPRHVMTEPRPSCDHRAPPLQVITSFLEPLFSADFRFLIDKMLLSPPAPSCILSTDSSWFSRFSTEWIRIIGIYPTQPGGGHVSFSWKPETRCELIIHTRSIWP